MKSKTITADFKNLLWATDFSRESRACIPYVKCFAGKLKTKNHAVYVLPKFSDWVYETALVKDDELMKTIDHTRQKSIRQIEKYSKEANIDFSAEVIEGIESQTLLEYADNNNVDLIFMGRRGISEIEQILIGSTTSRVIRSTHIPVFIVPRIKKEARLEKILCPIDLGENSVVELRFAIKLARQMGAKLYVTHVSEFFNYKIPVFAKDELLRRINLQITETAAEMNYEISEIIYETGEPAHKIISLAKKLKADLITLTTHQRKGIEKMFLGSISEKILLYSDIPVLILPPGNYDIN